MNENLFELFRRSFPNDPGRVFLERPDGSTVSYGDLLDLSGRVARILIDLGVEPGDRVAAQVEKSAEALLVYLGALRAGAVYLPLNTAYTEGEIRYFLGDAEPKLFVCRPEQREQMEKVAREQGVAHVLTLGEQGDGSLWQRVRAASAGDVDVPRSRDDLAAFLYTSNTPTRSLSAVGRIFSTLWWFGVTLLALLAAVAVAFFAPALSRLAGQSLTREIGGTLGASAILWIGLPLLGLLLIFTIVGVPVSLAIWFGLMPLLWLVGFAVSSIRVGDEIAARVNLSVLTGSPVGPAILGVLVLRLVGLVPVIGGLVVFLAGILGAGALAWRLWRERQTTKATPLPPVSTASP